MKNGDVKRWGILDYDTGEVYATLLIPLKPKIGGKWMKVFMAYLEWLALHPLRGETYRVLLSLMSKATYGNTIPTTTQTAKNLSMKAPSVSRAYRQLKENGVIVEQDGQYQLSPLFCWRGNAKQHQEAIKRISDQVMKAVQEGATQ